MNANIFSGKIEMTKAEAKAAGKIGSDKYNELRQYMKEFPGFEIQIKAPAKRKVNIGANNAQSQNTERTINPKIQIPFRNLFNTFSFTIRMAKHRSKVNNIFRP